MNLSRSVIKMTAFDKAWGIVKNDPDELADALRREGYEVEPWVREPMAVDFEKIKAGEPCYACHMDNAPEMCKGATHSYHGGAGGLFTYCKPQLNKIMQDPTISGDDLSWIDDIREM